jgi:hypothetical protein
MSHLSKRRMMREEARNNVTKNSRRSQLKSAFFHGDSKSKIKGTSLNAHIGKQNFIGTDELKGIGSSIMQLRKSILTRKVMNEYKNKGRQINTGNEEPNFINTEHLKGINYGNYGVIPPGAKKFTDKIANISASIKKNISEMDKMDKIIKDSNNELEKLLHRGHTLSDRDEERAEALKYRIKYNTGEISEIHSQNMKYQQDISEIESIIQELIDFNYKLKILEKEVEDILSKGEPVNDDSELMKEITNIKKMIQSLLSINIEGKNSRLSKPIPRGKKTESFKHKSESKSRRNIHQTRSQVISGMLSNIGRLARESAADVSTVIQDAAKVPGDISISAKRFASDAKNITGRIKNETMNKVSSMVTKGMIPIRKKIVPRGRLVEKKVQFNSNVSL